MTTIVPEDIASVVALMMVTESSGAFKNTAPPPQWKLIGESVFLFLFFLPYEARMTLVPQEINRDN